MEEGGGGVGGTFDCSKLHWYPEFYLIYLLKTFISEF